LMMQNYLITYGLIPRQLDLRPEAGGVHKASLELGVLSYDQDGRKLNGVDTRIEDNIPAKRYALIPEEGYHLYQTVTIPVTASSVRLAVRDTAANQCRCRWRRFPKTLFAPATLPTTGLWTRWRFNATFADRR
jgi:hypothetical protein